MCVYVRPLTEEERRHVQGLLRSSDAATYRHARVVLLSSESQKVPQIVQTVGVSERWVREIVHRFNQHGISSLPRRRAPGAKRLCDEATRSALVELLRRSPTEFGIESRLWTGAELATIARQQAIAPAISARTARREIRRAGYRWQQAKRWSAKEPEYERKKTARALGGTRPSRGELGSGV